MKDHNDNQEEEKKEEEEEEESIRQRTLEENHDDDEESSSRAAAHHVFGAQDDDEQKDDERVVAVDRNSNTLSDDPKKPPPGYSPPLAALDKKKKKNDLAQLESDVLAKGVVVQVSASGGGGSGGEDTKTATLMRRSTTSSTASAPRAPLERNASLPGAFSVDGIDTQSSRAQSEDGADGLSSDDDGDEIFWPVSTSHSLEEEERRVQSSEDSDLEDEEDNDEDAVLDSDIAFDSYVVTASTDSSIIDSVAVSLVNDEDEKELEALFWKRVIRSGIALFGISLFAVLLPVILFFTSNPKSEATGLQPLLRQTLPPSTPAPTPEDFALLVTVLEPFSLPGVFDDRSSSQYKALQWMSGQDVNSARFVQRYVLAVFYYALMGDNWICRSAPNHQHHCDGQTVPWLSLADECTWSLVSCNEDGMISELHFETPLEEYTDQDGWQTEHFLQGTLPGELNHLSELSALVTKGHFVSGSINVLDFDKLPKLKVLALQGSRRSRVFRGTSESFQAKFSGSIPATIGQSLPALESIDLRDNEIAGPIPSSLSELNHLKELQLGGNRNLTGTIPFEITSLPGLTSFDLQDCGLSGDLSSLFLYNRASALDTLQLGGNALRGTFGSEFSELSELRVLNLGNSSVEGKIPSELYRLSKLEHLHLQNANFYGELSEEFRFLNQTIKTINLKGNNFYGDVPKALDDCLELEYLDLSDNPGITGRISKSICARRTRTSAVTPFHVVDGIDFLGIPCSVQCNCCGFRDECDEKSP